MLNKIKSLHDLLTGMIFLSEDRLWVTRVFPED